MAIPPGEYEVTIIQAELNALDPIVTALNLSSDAGQEVRLKQQSGEFDTSAVQTLDEEAGAASVYCGWTLGNAGNGGWVCLPVHSGGEERVLVQHHILVVSDSSHAATSEEPALAQHHYLVVSDSTHVHLADNIVLGVAGVLIVQDGQHEHTVDNVALVQQHTLVVQDSAHSHAADNIGIVVDLAVQDGVHSH